MDRERKREKTGMEEIQESENNATRDGGVCSQVHHFLSFESRVSDPSKVRTKLYVWTVKRKCARGVCQWARLSGYL